jgi:hypothetical protein
MRQSRTHTKRNMLYTSSSYTGAISYGARLSGLWCFKYSPIEFPKFFSTAEMGIEFLQNSIIPTRTKGYVAIFKKDISEEFTQRKINNNKTKH